MFVFMEPSDWFGAGWYRWWICWLGYWYACCWWWYALSGRRRAAWCCKGDGAWLRRGLLCGAAVVLRVRGLAVRGLLHVQRPAGLRLSRWSILRIVGIRGAVLRERGRIAGDGGRLAVLVRRQLAVLALLLRGVAVVLVVVAHRGRATGSKCWIRGSCVMLEDWPRASMAAPSSWVARKGRAERRGGSGTDQDMEVAMGCGGWLVGWVDDGHTTCWRHGACTECLVDGWQGYLACAASRRPNQVSPNTRIVRSFCAHMLFLAEGILAINFTT